MARKKKEVTRNKNDKLSVILIFVFLFMIILFSTFEKDIMTFINSNAVSVFGDDDLINVKIDIPKKYEEIIPGEQLLVSPVINNPGSYELKDYILEYAIGDSGKIISTEVETVAIGSQIALIKYIDVPKDVLLGKYYAYLDVKSIEGVKLGSAKNSFNVVEYEGSSWYDYSTLIIAAISIIGAITIINSIMVRRALDKK